MLINRYNYEEFFLLYADGELPPLEVEIVEQFVQVHPDLKEELHMLMDCKLLAYMPVLFPKEKLYKQTAWEEENVTQTQSRLLLLLDNELPAFDKKILEKNIAENSVLELEWKSLQQTRFLAETVTHPNKETLYKQKRIPTIAWWRWAAAAAAAVGVGMFFIGKNVGENKTGTLPIIATINQIIPSVKSVQPTQNVILTNEVASTQAPKILKNTEPEKQDKNAAASINEQEKQEQNAVANNKEYPATLSENDNADVAENTSSQAYNGIDNNDERINLISHKTFASVEDDSNVKPQKAPAKFIGSTKTNLLVKNKITPKESLASLQADADDNEYVYIAGARVKKQQLRGVFRNITRGIGRTFSNSKVEAAPGIAVNN